MRDFTEFKKKMFVALRQALAFYFGTLGGVAIAFAILVPQGTALGVGLMAFFLAPGLLLVMVMEAFWNWPKKV